jgi:hypothetical protein
MPGPGFIHSLVDPKTLANANGRTRRSIVDGMLADVYTYPKWNQVLSHFGIQPATPVVSSSLIEHAARGGIGGEGDDHADFKSFVATHPTIAGVDVRVLETTLEYCLPTGDRIDVLFSTRKGWTAAEVKSAKSPEADLVRGVFQVVKYVALLEALAAATANDKDVSACLVLEGLSWFSVNVTGGWYYNGIVGV